MINIIPCSQIEQEAQRLCDLFEPCYKLTAQDADDIVSLAYSASLCGGSTGSSIIQNNKIQNFVTNGSSSNVATAFNSSNQVVVSEIELLNVINSYTVNDKIITDYYLLRTGKGVYGANQNNNVLNSDFIKYRDSIVVDLPPTEPGNEVVVVELTHSDTDAPEEIVNVNGPYVIGDNQDYYFIIKDGSFENIFDKKVYRFVGETGSYGLNQTQTVNGDFLLVESLDNESANNTDEVKFIKILETEAPIAIGSIPDDNVAKVINRSFRQILNTQDHTIHRFILNEIVDLGDSKRFDTVIYDWKGELPQINDGTATERNYSYIERIKGPVLSPDSQLENEISIVSVIAENGETDVEAINTHPEPIIKNNNQVYIKVSNDFEGSTDYRLYKLTAADGTYGAGNTQITAGDILLLENEGEEGGDTFVEAGDNITVTGDGTLTNPYIVTGDDAVDTSLYLNDGEIPSARSVTFAAESSLIFGNLNGTLALTDNGIIANNYTQFSLLDINDNGISSTSGNINIVAQDGLRLTLGVPPSQAGQVLAASSVNGDLEWVDAGSGFDEVLSASIIVQFDGTSNASVISHGKNFDVLLPTTASIITQGSGNSAHFILNFNNTDITSVQPNGYTIRETFTKMYHRNTESFVEDYIYPDVTVGSGTFVYVRFFDLITGSYIANIADLTFAVTIKFEFRPTT